MKLHMSSRLMSFALFMLFAFFGSCSGSVPPKAPLQEIPPSEKSTSVGGPKSEIVPAEAKAPQPKERVLSEKSFACPPHPKNALIVQFEEIPTEQGYWVKVIPVNGEGPHRFAQIRSFISDVNNDRTGDVLVRFGTQTPEGLRPSCTPDGLCRQAILVKCSDKALVEVFPEAPYGTLRAGNRNFRRGEESWMAIKETRWQNQLDGNHEEVRKWVKGEKYELQHTSRTEEVSAPLTIKQTEYGVTAFGLPAVSRDGKRVALIREFSWYDNSGYMDFMVYRIADGTPMRTIRLAENTGAEEGDSVGKIEGGGTGKDATQNAIRTANTVLKRGDFLPLIPLGDIYRNGFVGFEAGGGFAVYHDEQEAKLVISGVGEATVELPGIPSMGYCCHAGMGEPNDPCDLPAMVTRVWTDGIRGVVVIQYENYNGPDGCETEREYVVKGFSPKRPTNRSVLQIEASYK